MPQPGSEPELRSARVTRIFANQARWLARNSELVLQEPSSITPDTPGAVAIVSNGILGLGLPSPQALDRFRLAMARPGGGTGLAWSARFDPELDLLLQARGYRLGFRPVWMHRCLAIPLPDRELTGEVEIVDGVTVQSADLLRAQAVPYLAGYKPERIQALARVPVPERRTWMAIARAGNQVAGAGVLHLDEPGPDRLGMVFNLGVDPAFQRRGIATALMRWLSAIATEQGACGLVLNATPDGEHLYRALGFHTVGFGQTWFAPVTTIAQPPSTATVRVAEALGRGNHDDLDPTIARWPYLPNDDSPIVFARRFRQSATVDWLRLHGATD